MYPEKNLINSLLIVTFLITACNSNEEKLYHDNGQLKAISSLKNGKRHGKAYFYSENGSLKSKCYFENGLRQGEGMFYYPNHIIEQYVLYHNDTIIKSATYRNDGTLEIVKKYNSKGKLIDYNYYLDSGRIDPDPYKKFPIFLPENDSVKQGEIYKTEIRLGHRFYSSIYVFLGDTTDLGVFSKPHIKRIYKEVSILEVDTDTCEPGKNIVHGQILETCDTCQGYAWVGSFKHEFYVLPADSIHN